jgi:hypothetical protein
MEYGTVQYHEHTYNFDMNHYYVDYAFKYGDGVKFWGYVEKTAESLSVEFCNFLQRSLFINYVTFNIRCGKQAD